MTEKLEYRQWRFENMTAAEALSYVGNSLGSEVSRGFVLSPEQACFCTLRGSGADVSLYGCDETAEGQALDPDLVFEFRLFGPNFDARWERTSGLTGELRICSDSSATGHEVQLKQPNDDVTEKGGEAVPYVIKRENRYLIWGEPVGKPGEGGTKLTSSRIGTLWVPVESSARVELTAYEYFGTAKYGNAVFVGERLTGLRAVADDGKKSGASQ
ncbi:hypothetical protein Rvan_1877 [Rhodomicrobium vannielii ATCC 17100]|uniref:Uncharacterized protein n=1 Tax=Rhodomicrobium vannielii (strain ATCC 17100 / DSM 162 / LMG 4299 / NCIMB 10020 / ATH 3.1.1) TaxID=648757 RepID=E3I081_RHOVT|nr:CRISPR-associated protein Csx19 [Rhodomicrobium vannielii]ADP71116.1 hypothetical protein Rvan_1877 [Rhodomicrobium vannielii ATCC 17100]